MNIDNNLINNIDEITAANNSLTADALGECVNLNITNSQQTTYNPLEDWKPYLGKCPHCGSTNIEANYGVVLTSMPPQYNCRCKDCKGTFFSGQINQENQTITPYIPGLPVYPTTQPQKPQYDWGNIRQGWICPRCGKVNSPDRDFCDCSDNGWGSPIVWCNANGTSGNNPNPAPTITVSGNSLASNENNIVDVVDLYSSETRNSHKIK